MPAERTGKSLTNAASATERSDLEALRAENERLKELVIRLTAIAIRHVFYEGQRRAKSSIRASSTRAEQVLVTADACFSLARLPNMRPELSAALETVGNELNARAVEIDTQLDRRNEH